MQLVYKTRLVLASSMGIEALLPRSPSPPFVSINLTENCQARCTTCNLWQTQKHDAITTRRAKSLINEIAQLEVEYLRWAGGEPLLREDLFEILSYVPRNRFSKVILGTNGHLLGKHTEEINRSCITHITVSLDGAGETHRKLRGIDFRAVWGALAGVSGKCIKIVSILTKYLAQHIEELLDLCEREGYDYDLVLPSGVLPYSSSEEIRNNLSGMWPSEEQVNEVLNATLRRGKVTQSIADGARVYMLDNTSPFRRCILGYTELRITANGDVYTTCFELGPVGNIMRAPLREILADDHTIAQARNMYRLNCSMCMVGWQTSRVFEHPLTNLPYIYKRIRRN